MGDRQPLGLLCGISLVILLVLTGHTSRGAEYYCDERDQVCREEPCPTCSSEIIYRSLTECELSCTRADSDVQSPWSCVLPPEQGPCRDQTRRWHFDLKDGECHDFAYGGCLGNANNFATKEQCRSVCEYRISQILPLLNITLGTRGEEERCLLPRPDGVCSQRSVGEPRFAYDQETGQCGPFEWGGCEEGGNVFASVLACQIQCEGIRPVFPVNPPPLSARSTARHEMAERHKAEMPADEDHDPCLLPPDPGTCGADSPRLFFDPALGVCRRFLYGGCGGNLNNFRSLESCYRTCHNASQEAETVAAACLAPKRTGSCSSSVIRFYYDAETGHCRAFRYSGCDGSENNFATLEACAAACRPAAHEMPDLADNTLDAIVDVDGGLRARRIEGGPLAAQRDPCGLPPEAGPCLAEQTRYHYDPVIGACRKFLYGGCEGNDNNFASLAECAESCGRRRPDRGQEGCRGPAKDPRSRNCRASIVRYTFAESAGRCERILFDGCGATANNYRTRSECERACLATDRPEPADRVCQLRPDPGPCGAPMTRYYYEPSTGRCRRFVYGGCRGNSNNFETMRECMSTCREVGPGAGDGDGSSDVDCAAPPVDPNTPACTARIQRFYYSVREGRCVDLQYGGCGATDNNFPTMASCERSCPAGVIDPTAACLERPAAVGDCLGRVSRYSYDPAAGDCVRFDYTGCGGNNNNFASRRQCLDRCRDVTTDGGSDVCTLSPEKGPCTGLVDRYFYNARVGRCQLFSYGGCEGNGNNFRTERSCMDRCSNTTAPPEQGGAACRQRLLVGNCFGNEIRYYFDTFENRCQPFIYSGCGGNSNNFRSRSLCEESCPPSELPIDPPQPDRDECRLAPETGPCFAAEERFYFDSERGQCRSFTYGGCAGNANNFATLAACSARCGGETARPRRCLAPPTGSCGNEPRRRRDRSFYYDARAGRCAAHARGACPSENSFRSAAECREECAVPEPARAVCALEFDRGDCAGRDRRWAYSTRSGRCQPFEYGGCNGNANRFETLAACLSGCRGAQLANVTEVPDACLEPPVVDDFCEPRDRTERFYTFNAERMRCEEFEFTGCEVGPNIHRSLSACERTCRSEDPAPPSEGGCAAEPRPAFGCTPGAETTVYFYVANRDTCLSLIDDGCLVGENMYRSREECLRSCGGGGDGGDSSSVCRLPIEPGRPACRGALRRWGFSTLTGRCERFTYTGCDGNSNSFETLADCRARCEDDDGPTDGGEAPEFCERPPRRLLGCRPSSREQRFYYNRESRTCESFTYNGCDVGDNMFASMERCMETCRPDHGGDGRDDQPRFCRTEPEEVSNCRPGRREIKYYYSPVLGRCRSYESVGCERGRNMFFTMRECEATCDADDGGNEEERIPQFCRREPERIPGCRPGRRETKYYFDVSSARCRAMQSVGCERGRNLFFSLSECEEACRPDDTDDGGTDMPRFCRIEPEEISGCRPGRRETKYYYSPTANRCLSFESVGCDRGRNVFFTLRECETTCDSGNDNAGEDVCGLRPDPGPCSRYETRWYRDPVRGTCETFEYGGCGGNGNNFATRQDCMDRCEENLAENEICNQPPETGERPCRAESTRYYWDTGSGVCRSYRFSGCGATDNNFSSLRECSSTCRRRGPGDGMPPVPEQCFLEPERKPQDAAGCGPPEKRYTYSTRQGFCVPFLYTGCEETENNFLARQECRDVCHPRDQCLLEPEAGRCDQRLTRYAFDARAGRCRRFTYSGCGGNANRFGSERACVLSCGAAADADRQEVCLLPPVEDGAVNCGVRETRYFFDSALGRCVSFTYTGCVTTANNFESIADCQSMCPEQQTAPRDDRDVCSLEKAPGACLARLLRYFYDAEERRCRPFLYSGCDGNANSFLTFRDCSDACAPQRRSLELSEAEVRSELQELMDKMAAQDKMALLSVERNGTALEP